MTKTPDTFIYGIHAVEELLANRINEIDRIYFDSANNKGSAFNLLKQGRKKKIPCQCIPAQRLTQMACTEKHQGVVAQCAAKPYDDVDIFLQRLENTEAPPVLLVPASCEDPRNLGALIRTCVAFNVSGILLERKQTTPLNATVAKTSAGMLEHISIVKPPSLEKVIKDLKTKGFAVIGAIAGTQTIPQEIDFCGPVIVIIGGEHRGIPPYLNKLCTDFTGIPIMKRAGSLNVSVAASILLYECAKQRGFSFLPQ